MVGSQARHPPTRPSWWVAGGGDAKCPGVSWGRQRLLLGGKVSSLWQNPALAPGLFIFLP